ncbi:hypothetical protein [Pseudoalteromonas sp. DL-6]|uniref:hypothetical protein n=1 Tax=Pseudoalteromonas sp. DL-6 TaxID=1390185 RepID=UPI00103D6343|nr:hypothetical protein [Pseudoalteromonas sp. DL-6]QBJ64914.1 hypothetical protein B1F84_17870 [Pseudoalteromonas sp. DL-6]
MLKTVFGVATSALLFISTSSVSAESAIEQIKKRAAEINELKTLIQSPDPALRLAAIDTMQNSKDLAMKELAFSTGINASDESVVALTIRNRFSEIDSFVVLLSKPEDNEKALKAYNYFGGKVLFKVISYDKDRATLVNDTHVSNTDKSSTISGLNLFLNSSNCQGAFKLAEDLSYKGTISCDKQEFPAVINLF